MFKLKPDKKFDIDYQKLTKGNLGLQKQFEKVFKLLRYNPFYPLIKFLQKSIQMFGVAG